MLRPPPLDRRPRVAAVQHVTEQPSRAIVAKRGGESAQSRKDTMRQHTADQDRAAWFARRPPACYPVNAISAAIGRVEPVVQIRNDAGDWVDPEGDAATGFRDLLDEYANRALDQSIRALAQLAAYRYETDGDYCVVTVANGDHVDYRIYPTRLIGFNKPQRGRALVKEIPNGTKRDGTAYEVPMDNVHRCWYPDPDAPARATSPVMRALEPLERFAAITSQIRRQTESRFALGGQGKMLWTPAEAHTPKEAGGPSPVTAIFQEIAGRALDEDDLRALVPPEIHWEGKLGKPEVLELGEPFDDALLKGKDDAAQDHAQAIDMPGLTAASGGPGEANHWNEWVLQDENWKGACQWVAEAVYGDITRIFWREVMGPRMFQDADRGRIERVRIWFDESEVVIRPDRSGSARELGSAGILRAKAELEANGFDPDEDSLIEDDWTPAEERAWRLAVISAGKVQQDQAGPGDSQDQGPATSPTNAQRVAPERPGGPPQLGPGGGNGGGEPRPPALGASARTAASSPADQANRALARVTRLRRDTGTRLLEMARVHLEHAVADAVRRAASRAGNARPGTRQAAAADELDRASEGLPGEPLNRRVAYMRAHGARPYLAALGLAASELLDDHATQLRNEAEARLRRSIEAQRQALEDAGLDPDLAGDDDSASTGAMFLAAGVLALSRSALLEGAPTLPDRGEVAGPVPGSLVAQTLDVASGTSTRPDFPTSPDEMPGVTEIGDPLEVGIGDQLALGTTYTWQHGFFGEPERPFDPHVDLDGSTFTSPDDPDIPAAEDWIPDPGEAGGFAPQDHPGCTCGWLVHFQEPSTNGEGGEGG